MKSKNAWRVVSGVMLGTVAACAAVSGLDQLEKVACVGDCLDAGLDAAPDVAVGSVDASSDAGAEGGSVFDQSGPETSAPDDAEADAEDDALADAESDATPPVDATPPNDGSCSAVVLDVTVGVFVTPTGTDDAACGTMAAPCRSVTAGIAAANGNPTRKTVYLAAGTYTEAITLGAGVHLVGGFHVSAGAWSFDCSATPSAVVTLQAPSTSNMTLIADNADGAAVSTLTVRSKATAGASETLFGIVARGVTTTVTLNDVTVQAANGGDGPTGGGGSPGASPGAGSCAPGVGTAGTTPAIGTGAGPGVFSASGYAPQSGGAGASGGAGTNGVQAPDGQRITYSTCSAVVVFGCNSGSAACQSGAGTNGCGGTGGSGGAGGSGGGSSVGVFAANGAQVTLARGSYRSGNGGRGGAGGGGGQGGLGTSGTAGAPKTCTGISKCQGIVCNDQPNMVAPGGAPGGTGGTGGAGSSGGGGSGGSSYALLSVTGGTILVTDSPALASGLAGGSASNGSAGASGTRGAF